MHLGDVIDGNVSLEKTHEDLDNVLKRLSVLQAPLCHVVGNHCLSAERTHLLGQLKLSGGTYYYRDLSTKWRLIVLDTVDVSLDRPRDHPYYAQALEYLDKHKGEPNAQEWNGGLSADQLNWLQDILRDTAEAGKFAVVCGHLPVASEAAFPAHILWDKKMVTDLFRVYSGAVKAYFAGHFHDGGYCLKDGVHHVTFEAILDSDHRDGSFGIVELHDSEIIIKGSGDMSSRNLSI